MQSVHKIYCEKRRVCGTFFPIQGMRRDRFIIAVQLFSILWSTRIPFMQGTIASVYNSNQQNKVRRMK